MSPMSETSRGLISRRHLMAVGLASFFWTVTPLQARTQEPLYASSRRDKQGRHFAVIFSPQKGDVASVELPDRAHGITPHPIKTDCVAVSRRPGRSSVVFGPDRKPHWFHTREDRHFQGHGIFSSDGRLFYTTENDYEGERGVIGVRDVLKDYKQIGEFSSHGVGPHEMALGADGKTLVIANGGILTHPDMGRQKLNLDVMQPSLVYMDARTGDLLEKCRLPQNLHQLSIRHFAMTQDGQVVIGLQHNGPRTERPPLIGYHRRGKDIELAKAPKRVHRTMRNYVGSVAVNGAGRFAAAACPRGNIVTFWDIKTRQYSSHIDLVDGCGVASSAQKEGFLLTSGLGKVGEYSLGSKRFLMSTSESRDDMSWDNHVSRLR